LLYGSVGSGYLLYGRSAPASAFSLGQQLGHSGGIILLALLIAGVLHWLAKLRFLRCFLITWTILVPLTLVGVAANHQQQRNKNLQQAMAGFADVVNNKNPAASATAANATSPVDEATQSPLQIVIERTTRNTVAFKQQEAAYAQAQRDLHLEQALQPGRMASAQGIAQSRDALAKYRNMLTEHQSAMKAYEDRNLSYIMETPEPTRSAALAGFQKSRAASDAAFDRFFAVEKRYVETAGQMLDLAQQALGRSHLNAAGKLVVPEPMHAQMLALYKTIDAEVAEEAAAQQNIQTLRAHYREQINHLVQPNREGP
jgi:hypothetical protein